MVTLQAVVLAVLLQNVPVQQNPLPVQQSGDLTESIPTSYVPLPDEWPGDKVAYVAQRANDVDLIGHLRQAEQSTQLTLSPAAGAQVVVNYAAAEYDVRRTPFELGHRKHNREGCSRIIFSN